MLRGLLHSVLLGTVMAATQTPGPARGQVVIGAVVAAPSPMRLNGYFAAPGYYGMSWGVPSYGSVRTYTSFSSPYGAGYAYGYAPYGILPGRYGVGLWRPGLAVPGYVYGAAPYAYRTYPVPYTPGALVTTPPVGAYAPGFGPSGVIGW
jgi:hypothetical protein